MIAFIDSGIAPKLEEEYGDRIVYTYNIVHWIFKMDLIRLVLECGE